MHHVEPAARDRLPPKTIVPEMSGRSIQEPTYRSPAAWASAGELIDGGTCSARHLKKAATRGWPDVRTVSEV